jgi:hypothetical protein
MTIRTFVPWGWARTLIYEVTAAVVLFLAFKLILTDTPEYSTLAKLPSLIIPAAWMAITYRLYSLRRAYAARIAWVTNQGVSVVPDAAKDWLATRRSRLESEIDKVTRFWDQRDPVVGRIDDFINGCALEVAVQDGPLVDPVHGIKAKAWYRPKRIAVTLPKLALQWDAMGQTNQFARQCEDEFFALVRHEFGHAALAAMGVPDEAHHAKMHAAGWVDA